MTELDSYYRYYRNEHWSQYDRRASSDTHRFGCTWTSLRNGVDAVTGGKINKTPDYVHNLVKRSEETNPTKPGWSLIDARRAAERMGIQLIVRTGDGWQALLEALNSGQPVLLQGDSDVFSNATCMGQFDGDHCILVHPERDTLRRQLDGDPICPGYRWIGRSLLREYASKFNPGISFAVFNRRVPLLLEPKLVLDGPGPDRGGPVMGTYAYGVVCKKTMRLAKGQPLFKHPGGPRVTSMKNAGEVGHVAAATPGWREVLVQTAVPYRDGHLRPTTLYVPRDAGPISPIK